MTDIANLDAYGEMIEPSTLMIRRVLPGPVERVWAFLTESDKRRRWLAAGEMRLEVEAPFELVWRNDELTNPPGRRPEGSSDEHRMQSRIIDLDPPRRLAFGWGSDGSVTFDLKPQGDEVLLTVTHRGISDRNNKVMIGAGWHMHLDVMVARLAGEEPEPFWDGLTRLRDDYDRRVPA